MNDTNLQIAQPCVPTAPHYLEEWNLIETSEDHRSWPKKKIHEHFVGREGQIDSVCSRMKDIVLNLKDKKETRLVASFVAGAFFAYASGSGLTFLFIPVLNTPKSNDKELTTEDRTKT
jgi:hypothetical protein